VIRLFIALILSAISFRGAARALEIIAPLLPEGMAPSPNGGQLWVLRLGLYELRRPKEQADDWVWMMDHTIQTGNGRCFVVVGFRLSQWEALRNEALQEDSQASFALEREHLSVWMIERTESSSGAAVKQQLETLSQETGITPCALLCDQGFDLRQGGAAFCQDRPTVVVHDIAHAVANAVKRQVQKTLEWDKFLTDANRSKSKLRQTAYAFLLPPDLKTKARWMNLEPLIAWTRRVQQFLDDPQAGLAKAQAPEDLQVLEEKIGWLRRYREPLAEWSKLMEAAGVILQYIRTHGYHRHAVTELRARVAPFQTESLEGFFAEVLAFVSRQASQAETAEQGDRRLPGSTEVLESLIGTGKQLQGRNKNGYTKAVLAMAASVVKCTSNVIQQAFEATPVRDVAGWISEKIGISLAAQRCRALTVHAGGTKPD
jgi:hypothetical protein